MKNSNLNNQYLNAETDLSEIFRTILNSKKLIILITLASSLLTFIYFSQEELNYNSTVILEIGSYDLINGEEKLVEPVLRLIKKLKVNLIYKQQLELGRNLNYHSIEGRLLKISSTSPSAEMNKEILKKAIIFSQESHTEILLNIVNTSSENIKALDTEIKFLKNSKVNSFLIKINALDNEIEFMKNSIVSSSSEKIVGLDSEIPLLESKIKYLLKLILEEEKNLLLLQSDTPALLLRASTSPTLQQVIYSYKEKILNLKTQIQNLKQEKNALELQLLAIEKGEFQSEELFILQQEKNSLELQLLAIEKGEFQSEELFILQQEKNSLELQLKLFNDQKNITRTIQELTTNQLPRRIVFKILIGAIFGFILSVLIVFTMQPFLKEKN
jgi:hypothetical protein